MKKKIRQGVFESNSSTSHAICIMKTSDFRKWYDGNLYYYNPYNYKWDIEHYYLNEKYQPTPKELYTEDEVRDFLVHNNNVEVEDFDDFEDVAYEFSFYSIEKFDEEYEIDDETFVTDNGESYTVHCAYGWDG